MNANDVYDLYADVGIGMRNATLLLFEDESLCFLRMSGDFNVAGIKKLSDPTLPQCLFHAFQYIFPQTNRQND